MDLFDLIADLTQEQLEALAKAKLFPLTDDELLWFTSDWAFAERPRSTAERMTDLVASRGGSDIFF